MRYKLSVLVGLILVLVMSSGCSSPRALNLTSADNGTTVALQVGGQISVKLDGNPSTGFTWEASGLDAGRFSQVGEAVFSSSSPGLVGSGGTLTMTFKVLKAGTSPLTLVYHQPWATGVAPLNTFTVTVTGK